MKELLTQFGVDWKLLLAQVVNFFILLFLLKKFAYTPVLNVLRDRRKKIEEGLAASEESQRKLLEAKEVEKSILLKAEQDSLAIITEAEQRAEIQGRQIIDVAHTKGEQVIAQGQKKLEEDRRKISEELERGTEALIRASLVKVIGKMEPSERDQALISEALRELKTLS